MSNTHAASHGNANATNVAPADDHGPRVTPDMASPVHDASQGAATTQPIRSGQIHACDVRHATQAKAPCTAKGAV